jgi:hypothetical protein
VNLNIRVTPRAVEAPARPRLVVRVAPRASEPAPTISPLAHDELSHASLTRAEAAEETRVAYAIIEEKLRELGIARSNIRVTHSQRFKGRMGDARTLSYDPANPTGVIRFSASPLWRRATPEKRRGTIIHELAHILANCEARRNVGHGRAWKRTMVRLGEKPERCHSVNRDGLRRRGARERRVVNEAATVYDFRVGERVSFHHKGREVHGRVAKRLRARLSIIEDGQTRPSWKVPAPLLRSRDTNNLI